MKWRWTALGVVGSLILLLIAAAAILPHDPVSMASTNGRNTRQQAVGTVSVPVISDGVNEETQEPLRQLQTVPRATKQIYASVSINLKNGQKLSAKWYYEFRHQPALDSDLDIPKDFEGWASFHINNGEIDWLPGNYYVEIYIDDKIQRTTKFTVN